MSTGFSRWDKILPGIIVAVLSCAKDISFLSRFSAVGLIVLAISFVVVSWEGVKENGFTGFTHVLQLNMRPESLSAASSWFGIVVFGYGVVPFIFSFESSMADPQLINLAAKLGLSIAYAGYLFASNGIKILFAGAHSFDGDMLQALPEASPISIVVRLLMISMVCVTAPLIAVPVSIIRMTDAAYYSVHSQQTVFSEQQCGEMIEGKLGIKDNEELSYKRILIRTTLCGTTTLLASLVPEFVHVISFVGAFCVSILSFVLPPMFILMLAKRYDPCAQIDLSFVALLFVGVATTLITSTMTFIDLMHYTRKSKVHYII